MYKDKKVVAIILAAGDGRRFSKSIPKQFYKLGNKTVLEKTIDQFSRNNLVDGFFVVGKNNNKEKIYQICGQNNKFFGFITGGETRQDSVFNSLIYLNSTINDDDYLLIHDGARPFVTEDIINKIVDAIEISGAVIPVVPVKDTIKSIHHMIIVDKSSSSEIETLAVEKTFDRSLLRAVQTPQGFTKKIIDKAYAFAKKNGIIGTDDASLVEAMGNTVITIEGSYENIKITTKEDVKKYSLESLEKLEENDREENLKGRNMNVTVGHGYDVHPLVYGRDLIIGGVKIDYEKGLDGHSDADVLVHAIMDALLGAAGLPDIGSYFPDNDEQYQNADSLQLLDCVKGTLENKNFNIGNIDATIIAEKPKMKPYIALMKENISRVLAIDCEKINIKATTTEKLGFTGRSEGIAAEAVCLLYKK